MDMRTESHLSAFVALKSIKAAAEVMSCTPWAVSLALRQKRDIRFELNSKGEVTGYYEIKRPERGVNVREAG